MKIDLRLSDLTKSATTECLKSAIFSAETNKFENHYVIVPETKSIIIERELLSLSSTKAFDNVFVYSFVRLISKLLHIDESRILNKQSAIMILRKIVNNNQKDFVCYKKAAKTVSFAEKIYETIQQFKSSNLLPEDVSLAAQNSKGALAAKLSDLALIFGEYEKLLQNKFYDDCDKLRLLSEFSKTSEEVKNSRFYVVGFDNITPEMENVLTDVAAKAKSIEFSSVFFGDKKPNKSIQQNLLLKKFTRIADKLKFPLNPVFVESKKQGDFCSLKDSLFSFVEKKREHFGSVKLYEASNIREEVDFVANKIIEEIKNGKRFNEIGVFVCNFDKYSEKVKDCFTSYGLPFFINEKQDISGHAFVNLIKSYFSLYESNLQAEDVINFCASPFFEFKGFSKFVNYVWEKGINYTEFLNAKSDDPEVQEILNFVAETFIILKQKLQNCKKISEYLCILTDFTEKIGAKSKLDAISESQRQDDFFVEAEVTKSIFSHFEKFNLNVENFLGDVQTDVRGFLQIYLSGFESIEISLSPLSIDSLIVQDTTDGFYGIKDLFVLGTCDGEFPKKLQDTGIILDSELLQTTKIVGKEIEPLIQEINDREQFKAYEVVLEPSEKLFISYPVKDAGGENKPSSIFSEIKKMYGASAVIKTYASHLFASKNGFEFRFAKHICRALSGNGNGNDLNEEYSVMQDAISPELEKRINEMASDNSFKLIRGAENLYFFNDKSSVTQLKTYFSCPYQFFATYGLKLAENKQAQISSIDIGVIIHKVAELFISKVAGLKECSDSEIANEINATISDAISELKINTTKNRAVLNLVKSESFNLCKYLLFEQQNSNFKMVKTEYEFKGKNAIKIELGNGKNILIEGKIDRIDKFKNFIRIIDYKTGTISSDLNLMYYGKDIQLVTYLSAVGEGDGLEVAGLFYFPVQSNFAKDDKSGKSLYQMQGFVIDDVDVIKNMDLTLGECNLSSAFIGTKLKMTDDGFEIASSGGNAVMSAEDFKVVDKYNRELCKKAISEIIAGNIEPSPLKESKSDSHMMCDHCKLAGYCGLENAKFSNGRTIQQKVEMQSFEVKENKNGK